MCVYRYIYIWSNCLAALNSFLVILQPPTFTVYPSYGFYLCRSTAKLKGLKDHVWTALWNMTQYTAASQNRGLDVFCSSKKRHSKKGVILRDKERLVNECLVKMNVFDQ